MAAQAHMKTRRKKLLWAAIIISVALILAGTQLDNAASTGVVIGLSGGAWASLGAEADCSAGCLK